MKTTLAERIHLRMRATGLTNADLAKASGVKQPTSYNWGSGKTASIKAEPLLKAAKALGVTPEWLATGKGPMLEGQSQPEKRPILEEKKTAYYINPRRAWAVSLVDQLSDESLEDAISQMEWLVEKQKKNYLEVSKIFHASTEDLA